MPKLTERDFINLAIGWIREHNQAEGDIPAEITGETDLINTGLLDSFGFVDLFLFLEVQGGCKIDLTDADPGEFSTIGGLCRIAMGNRRAEAHAPIG